VVVVAVLFALHSTLTDTAHIPFDAEYFHYPLLRDVQGFLSNGTLPGWDSYAYGGIPLLANAQSAWLYPPHLLATLVLAVLGRPLTEHTLDVVLVVHLVIAGLAMAAIVRRRGLGQAAAAYAGAFVVLMGGTISQAQHAGMIEALPSIVLAVLAVEHLARGITALRVVALGATVAMAVTAGFTPLLPATVALILGAAVARPEGRRPAVLGALAGTGLGIAIAAATLIPSAALINVYPPLPRHTALTTSTLVTAVLPNAFGHWEPLITQFSGTGLTNTYFYLGGTAVLLLPVALTSGRAALWDAGLALALILASFGAAAQHVADVLQSLPVVGTLWRPEDVVYVAVVPLALLLARGLARPPSKLQLGAAALMLLVLISVSFVGGHGRSLHFLTDAPLQTILALAATAVALSAAAWLQVHHRQGAAAVLALVAIVAVVDLATAVPGRYFINWPGPATSASADSTGDGSVVVSFLLQHSNPQDRIVSDTPDLQAAWAGFPSLWHLSDANGFQPQFSKHQLAAANPGKHASQLTEREFLITPALHAYLEAMGVRYVVVAAAADRFAGVRGYQLVFRDGLYHVYETTWPHDRAYLVDPACLHQRGDGLISCRTASRVTTVIASSIRRYGLATQSRATVLITGEPWYPGWHAHDDTHSLAVTRVGFLTAVSVPAGVHKVTMTYGPPGLLLGGAISLTAILGSVAAVAEQRRRRGRRRPAGATAH
jgi:hypothetical protein